METTKVKVTMENGQTFVIELCPEQAPITCENFLGLVKEGFYNGLTFHRVIEDFMAQGGDPEGTGFGGSSKTIKGEFARNGFKQNTLSHTRGVISMARSSDYDSASSQFFICYDDASFLDGSYAAFGMVTEGMEVVDGFLEVERRYNSSGELASPVEPIVIEKAEVITRCKPYALVHCIIESLVGLAHNVGELNSACFCKHTYQYYVYRFNIARLLC